MATPAVQWNERPTHLTFPRDEPQGELAIRRLAERGFRVFPVVAGDKLPLIAEWPKVATCDLKALESWGHHFPGRNWGLACGPDSGVFVLDADGVERFPEAVGWKPSTARQKMLRREIEFVRIGGKHPVPAGNGGELDRARDRAGTGAAVMETVACDVARMVTILKVLRHLRSRPHHATAKRVVL